VALGTGLRGLVHAAIDVSDGLLADLGHILEQSGVAAEVEEARLPAGARDCAPNAGAQLLRQCVLGGGDDYELLFTAAPADESAILALGQRLGVPLTAIGRILEGESGNIRLIDPGGRTVPPPHGGYDHFT
jgi:thiamine-monophosphate kinase